MTEHIRPEFNPTAGPMSDPNSDENAQHQQATQAGDAAVTAQELQSKIEQLEAQLKDKDQKYVYLYAEFENYKKRAIKERSDLAKFGWEGTARELLGVVDNLERALAHMPESTDKNLVQGIQMVLNQFRASLEKQGVQYVQSLKQAFDPNVHEAVGQTPSEEPAGTIVQEHERGYMLHGRLLRPARVIISQGPLDGSGNSNHV